MLGVCEAKFEHRLGQRLGRFIDDGRPHDELRIPVAGIEYRRQVQRPQMHCRNPKQPDRAHNAGQWKIGVLAHLIEPIADYGVLGHTDRQQVVAVPGGVGEVDLEGQRAPFVISQAPAVKPDLGAAIDPLEAQLEPSLPRRLPEPPAVAADPLGGLKSLHFEMSRHPDIGPMAVIEPGFPKTGRRVGGKSPDAIEAELVAMQVFRGQAVLESSGIHPHCRSLRRVLAGQARGNGDLALEPHGHRDEEQAV